jgi:hypothetical protein
MIYAFQVTFERDLDKIIKFMGDVREGIFVLPEGFLDLKSSKINDLAEITKNTRNSVITGVKKKDTDPWYRITAHVFAYGEQEPVYHENQIFTLPDGDNKVRTNIRVCADIWKQYNFKDFELLANPSSLSLEGLITAKSDGWNDYNDLFEMLRLQPRVIASSTCMYSKACIIDPSGKPAGEFKDLGLEHNELVGYVSYEMNKKGLAGK